MIVLQAALDVLHCILHIYGTRCDFILINISIYFSNSCRGGEGVGNINIVPTCSTTDAYDIEALSSR